MRIPLASEETIHFEGVFILDGFTDLFSDINTFNGQKQKQEQFKVQCK
jgi:hypothetical protein